MSPHTLIVMRHAKSAWPPDVPDFERPLSKRGGRDAAAAGRLLAAILPAGATVLVSPAVRTRATWDLVARELPAAFVSRFSEAIYQADSAELLTVVAELDADVRTAMLVGHNPGCTDLVAALAGGALDQPFPTAAFAVLEIDGTWQDPGAARLSDFVVPRG